MGLDMYGYTMRADFVGERQTDIKLTTAEEKEQAAQRDIAYWRKFHHLHGWMAGLYEEKGGQEDCFNCCNVRLNEADLDRLALALDEDRLAQTPGFFFGDDEINEQDIVDTRAFITAAREAIRHGEAVFYDSWW